MEKYLNFKDEETFVNQSLKVTLYLTEIIQRTKTWASPQFEPVQEDT